jgi:hypothetical protein
MTSQGESRTSRTSRERVMLVAAVALLIGMALGPSIASATSAAWIRVKNWPAVQKVLLVNPASAPVYTQPPSHTIVNLHASAAIPNAGTGATVPFYTVPSNQWLVITSMNAQGNGTSSDPISFVEVQSPDTTIHETIPIQLTYDNGLYHLSSSVGGTSYVPPGTVLQLSLFRETAGDGPWNAEVWADGYLTSNP